MHVGSGTFAGIIPQLSAKTSRANSTHPNLIVEFRLQRASLEATTVQ